MTSDQSMETGPDLSKTRKMLWKLILSAALSLLVLGLIFGLLSKDPENASRARLVHVLVRTSAGLAGLYLLCQLAQAFFRAIRYRVLLAGCGEKNVPSLFRMYLATLGRNMLVDLLPARAGELGYIALVNQGYQVSMENAVTSMTMSLFFDFAALFLLALMMLTGPLLGAGSPGLLLVPAIAAGLASLAGGTILFAGIPITHRQLSKWTFLHGRKSGRVLLNFIGKLAASTARMETRKTFAAALALSLAVRVIKYGGLYAAFVAVTHSAYPEMAGAPFWKVIMAFLTAEGAAALPIPSFMSFGTYEAGGLAAFGMMGFPVADAAMAVLAVHILSQVIDYALGGLGLIMFFFSTQPPEQPAGKRIRPGLAWAAVATLAFLLGAGVFAYGCRSLSKRGALAPPQSGERVPSSTGEMGAVASWMGADRGFIIWSSNRDGDHNLYQMSLPGLEVSQLTRHPHIDYYPRISPNGKFVVFSRSQLPWVSQRDPLPWDVYLLDLETGKERLVATNGNTPSWTSDGQAVVFQRNGGEVIQCQLSQLRETRLLSAGEQGIPSGVHFQTPEYNDRERQLALTLRNRAHATGVYDLPKKRFTQTGAGCMLSWAGDYDFLYYVDSPGRQKNAIYRFRLGPGETGDRELWLDLPEPYSHEYFPRRSNDGKYLVLGASTGGHEHDSADYEIFLWKIGTPADQAARLTYHTGNDCWPDVFIAEKVASK
ncbi:MAG: lysylphosphatidylglycerol synthase domain-containing protein [Lentisphaerota bacterium]